MVRRSYGHHRGDVANDGNPQIQYPVMVSLPSIRMDLFHVLMTNKISEFVSALSSESCQSHRILSSHNLAKTNRPLDR